MTSLPTLNNVLKAQNHIGQYIHRTPVLTCSTLNDMVEGELFFKCDNFQKTGSFKIRGATNAVFSLNDAEAARGVATHSSGNFAQALAQAARWRGIRAYIIMPNNSPDVKKNAVAGYGADIVFCTPTLEAREAELAKVVKKTGAAFIHPYNDAVVIAGQGTAGLELCAEVDSLDAVITPVGGGGLLSGTSLAVKGKSPDTKIFAAEPKGADDAYRSLKAGRIIPSTNPKTIADGLLTSLGDITFSIIQTHVSEIITVSEQDIVAAMQLIWERMKIVVEPSAAVTLGAILTQKETFKGKRTGVILSGGNVDLSRYFD